MTRKRSIDDIIAQINTKHDGVVSIDASTFIDIRTPARFIDKDYGEWWIKPIYVLAGVNHNERGRVKLRASIDSQRLSLDEVVRCIEKTHENRVVLDVSTFKGIRQKACFIDIDYGEWWSRPNAVMTKSGHPDRALSASCKTQKKHPVVLHWKTNAQCYSQSSYEYATLLWLNANKLDFEWQVPFKTPMLTRRGRNAMYYIDLHILTGKFADTYVEIKGTWNKRVKHNSITPRQKWDWFHEAHPNSALWMQSQLTELNILDVKGRPHPDLLSGILTKR